MTVYKWHVLDLKFWTKALVVYGLAGVGFVGIIRRCFALPSDRSTVVLCNREE